MKCSGNDGVKGGVTEQEMTAFLEREIRELGVGSEEFFRHHKEILEMIENSAKGVNCNCSNNEKERKR